MPKISSLVEKIKKNGIQYVFKTAIPYWSKEFPIELIDKLGYKLYKNKHLQDVIIIESHNDFDSNGGAFYDYLIANGYNKKYKIVWFLRNECPKNLPDNVEGYRYNRPSLKRVYYHCVAKYIVCGHYMIPSLRSEQKSVYTSHGAFSLKNSNGKIFVPDEINYVLIPSEDVAEIQAHQYSMNSTEKLIVLGFPCHDILYNNALGDLSKITSAKYNKTILWMPTLRQGSGRNDFKTDSSLGIPIFKTQEEYQNLNEWLKKHNVLLIIKIHPMQDLSKVKVTTESNIMIITGSKIKELGVDNYRLMKDVDALISDYSSSSFDFLHLNRPIAYTLEDLNDYKLGLPVDDPDDYIGGQKIYNKDGFYSFLKDVADGNDRYAEVRKKCFGRVFKYHDGNSCKRLCEFLNL